MGREREFKIGRDKDCDIAIADESVSRLHAVASLIDDELLFLTDCHSTNGTVLVRQGREIALGQEFLSPTDSVRFGDVTLSVSELMQVLGRKHAVPQPERLSQPGVDPPPHRLAAGGRMVRCSCGTVIPRGQKCPTCRQ